MNRLKWFPLLASLAFLPLEVLADPASSSNSPSAVIIPIREEVSAPLTFLVRRGVKEAIRTEASILILDMETPGGRLDHTDQIIELLNRFNGRKITLVNRSAYSAGSFIALATTNIYMVPQSVIGAATPIMVNPLDGSAAGMPESVEAKMTSAVKAKVRAIAQRNGHNPDVAEAMIDRTKKLEIDGNVINAPGSILTLTDVEAAAVYGNPPKALLSAGTVADMDALLTLLGVPKANVLRITPTGMETLAFWIGKISPILLLIGILGVYLEFKTPGFGAPGIVGGLCLLIYFFGAYVAGLSGFEWLLVFLLGLALVVVEFFVLPGTLAPGIIGGLLMVTALVMATVDRFPGMPAIPSAAELERPLTDLAIAFVGSIVGAVLFARFLPSIPVYRRMVGTGVSGEAGIQKQGTDQKKLLGLEGVTVSVLRPGGKIRVGEKFLDAVSRGELVESGKSVRIVGFSGSDCVVEAVTDRGRTEAFVG